MKYELQGGNLPVVICHLDAGESMITERGSMAWMSPNMKMETGTNGGSYLVYKSGTLGTYSDFTEFVDKSDEEPPAPEVVKGDMDGDGKLTTDDAVYLLLNVMFDDINYPITNPDKDMNNDDKINTDDAVYLLLHVMFGAINYHI